MHLGIAEVHLEVCVRLKDEFYFRLAEDEFIDGVKV